MKINYQCNRVLDEVFLQDAYKVGEHNIFLVKYISSTFESINYITYEGATFLYGERIELFTVEGKPGLYILKIAEYSLLDIEVFYNTMDKNVLFYWIMDKLIGGLNATSFMNFMYHRLIKDRIPNENMFKNLEKNNFKRGGNHLGVYTKTFKDIYCEDTSETAPDELKVIELGNIGVELNLLGNNSDSSIILVDPDEGESRGLELPMNDTDELYIMHPHQLNDNGGLCWGTLSYSVEDALYNLDINALNALITEGLSHYNFDDTYGLRAARWVDKVYDEYNDYLVPYYDCIYTSDNGWQYNGEEEEEDDTYYVEDLDGNKLPIEAAAELTARVYGRDSYVPIGESYRIWNRDLVISKRDLIVDDYGNEGCKDYDAIIEDYLGYNVIDCYSVEYGGYFVNETPKDINEFKDWLSENDKECFNEEFGEEEEEEED